MEPESGVEGVTGFVPENSHALRIVSALDLEHLLAFELNQARVREVKRYRDSGHAVGRKPLLGQPNMGFKADSAAVQLAVKPLDVGLQKRPLDFDWQVANAQLQQLFVTETVPGESITHWRILAG